MKTRIFVAIGILFLSSAAFAQTADQQISNLQKAGFASLGEGFFAHGSIAVHVEKDGSYELLVPFESNSKPSEIKAIRKDAARGMIEALYVDAQGETSALERSANGGGGGTNSKNAEALRLAQGLTLNQQLLNAGFRSINTANSIWVTSLENTNIVLFLKGNSITGFYKPGRTDLSVKLKDTLIEEYSEQKSEYGDDKNPVLTVQNSLMKFNLVYQYDDFSMSGTQFLKDLKDVELSELGFSLPVPAPHKDANGFMMGGMNPTNLILSLTSIDGNTVDAISQRARQTAGCSHGDPLLAPQEDLLKNMAIDNEKVIKLNLTHQNLAKPLLYAKALIDGGYGNTFMFYGAPYEISNLSGPMWCSLDSPFDSYSTSIVFPRITNLKTNKYIDFSLLHPALISEYGFYGSHENRSYVSPEAIMSVFEYLKH